MVAGQHETGAGRLKISPLVWAANNGRVLLIAGLVAGVMFPGTALLMKDYLGLLVCSLLFLNAFRIGTSATLGSSGQLKYSVVAIAFLQLIVPSALVVLFWLFEFSGPTANALVLMASASCISGALGRSASRPCQHPAPAHGPSAVEPAQ